MTFDEILKYTGEGCLGALGIVGIIFLALRYVFEPLMWRWLLKGRKETFNGTGMELAKILSGPTFADRQVESVLVGSQYGTPLHDRRDQPLHVWIKYTDDKGGECNHRCSFSK